MRALTVEEARRRAADLAVRSYQVAFDLTGTGDTFVTTSRIRFAAASDTTWVDVKPERLLAVELNGRTFYECKELLCLCRDRSCFACPPGVACVLQELDGHAHR
jgi:hypothetical protein